MSVTTKKATGGEYVYFQVYYDGERKEEYLGRKGDASIAEKAIDFFLKYQDYKLKQFLLKLESMGYKIQKDPREVRRRRETSKKEVDELEIKILIYAHEQKLTVLDPQNLSRKFRLPLADINEALTNLSILLPNLFKLRTDGRYNFANPTQIIARSRTS